MSNTHTLLGQGGEGAMDYILQSINVIKDKEKVWIYSRLKKAK